MNQKGIDMQRFITEYIVRVIVGDIPQEYRYYSQASTVKVLKTLRALKKPYVYEVHLHNLH
jgi:hypothetical protein